MNNNTLLPIEASSTYQSYHHPTNDPTSFRNQNGKRSLSSSSLSSTPAATAAVVVASAGVPPGVAVPISSTTTTTTVPSGTSMNHMMTTNGNIPNHNTSHTSKIDKKGAPLTEQKLRRLEKNRLSARECRRRKREATEHTQHQINLLEGENLRLRLQLQVGEEAEVSTQDEQQRLTQVLDDLLKSGASENEIYMKIEEYKEKFADYGRDRRSSMEFHLKNIERLLMPTQTTSVVLTTLGGSTVPSVASTTTPTPTPSLTTFSSSILTPTVPPAQQLQSPNTTDNNNNNNKSNENLDAKTLFRHLVDILQVTPEQAAALKDSRFVAKEMDECLQESFKVLQELRKRLIQCGEDLEHEFDSNVRSILTPTQAAKFLVWVANNKACMHMLNELWNRVYPQNTTTYPTTHATNPQQYQGPTQSPLSSPVKEEDVEEEEEAAAAVSSLPQQDSIQESPLSKQQQEHFPPTPSQQ